MPRALLVLALSLIVGAQAVDAQSANFIAQGHYYKAKELFEEKKYAEAVRYIGNSKQSLGGTNYQLQYLHIRSLVYLQDFVGARREMETYFRILDREAEAKGFTRIVERLTDDETTDLSKLMIDIMEKASGNNRELNLKTLGQLLSESIGHARRIDNGNRVQPFYITRNQISVNGNQAIISSFRSSHPPTRPPRIRMLTRMTGRAVFFDEFPCDYFRDERSYNFPLADIVSVQRSADEVRNDVLGIVEVQLRGASARYTQRIFGPDKSIGQAVGTEGTFREQDVGKCIGDRRLPAGDRSESVSVVYFTYLKSNPASFNEIKRILETLKAG